MRKEEVILKAIFIGAILAGLAMAAVAAGQEFREHSAAGYASHSPGGTDDPGELVRVAGKVCLVRGTYGRREIVLCGQRTSDAPDFTRLVVAVRWSSRLEALPFEPRIGEWVTVCGFSRFDRGKDEWQVNPLVPCPKGAP